MATLQDIKRRIRSVRNTRKITKAMELVAAARLRRAEERIVQMRDYADRMQELTAGTARAAASLRGLKLLQQREQQTVAIVALTGDRGLAGAFNGDVAPLVQRVTEQQLLPISEEVLSRSREEEEEERQALLGDFIYEPEPEQILERLLPVYLETEVYRSLLESSASELGARMTAMRNASSNAGDLIETLTLDLNRARQAEITQEILEV